MMVFYFDIQYSLFDILQLKELLQPLNTLIRNNDKWNELSVPRLDDSAGLVSKADRREGLACTSAELLAEVWQRNLNIFKISRPVKTKIKGLHGTILYKQLRLDANRFCTVSGVPR